MPVPAALQTVFLAAHKKRSDRVMAIGCDCSRGQARRSSPATNGKIAVPIKEIDQGRKKTGADGNTQLQAARVRGASRRPGDGAGREMRASVYNKP